MFKYISTAGFFLSFCLVANSQIYKTPKIHSHNDYLQAVPFWTAYANGLNSIEVDVFLKNNELYATHDEKDIIQDRTIENLYLEPVQSAIELKLGENQIIQFLIDIKSDALPTLEKLIEILAKYPKLTTSDNISFVISGNRPPPELYINYPSYIQFDHQSSEILSNSAQWEKVAMISQPFSKFSSWNGKGRLTKTDYDLVLNAIKTAHSYQKPFRFWACPDSKTAWKAFTNLGVDFINTDMPYEAKTYLNSLPKRVYFNTMESKIYKPTYASDKKNKTVKNIILLIGDGNGLSQISSAVLSNGGSLTLTQLKSIGFIKTQSTDDFTTDSAAAGTAISSGKKTYNRSIGMDTTQKPIENITEMLYKHNFKSGFITTDQITGATPAAFYAHQTDRDMTDGIFNDLLESKLDFFIGGGGDYYKQSFSKSRFSILNSMDEIGVSKKDRIGYFLSDKNVPSVLEKRGNLLAEATHNGLKFLEQKKKSFFLMVEAAQIDSYGHQNDISGIISEGIDFDKAITEAIKFADKNGKTLVLITADHETSGLSLPQGDIKNKMMEGEFTTYDHTGVMVPIFAYGPQSGLFSGVYENNEIFHKIKKVLGID
jgi:alkaline phosphatase